MDGRIIILVAAAALVVVALVVLVVVLVGASRRGRNAAHEADLYAAQASGPTPTAAVDTSLEGLKVEVSPNSPSAALLTPLRTGDWRPPDEPAPADHLPAASLAERMKGYESPVLEPVALSNPMVRDESASGALLANLPDVRRETDAAAVALPQSTVPAPPPVPEPTPRPAPVPAREPESEPPRVPAPPPVPEPTPQPAPVPAREPESEPPPVVTPAVTFAWQRSEIQPTADSAPGAIAESPLVPVAHARPRATIRAIPDEVEDSLTSDEPPHTQEPVSPHPASAEYVEMVAPVEMWFGDYRVGVKSGSATHVLFRKYADVLLGELKDADKRSR